MKFYGKKLAKNNINCNFALQIYDYRKSYLKESRLCIGH
jgi:hypothetical protein